jgi:hypothetical protein
MPQSTSIRSPSTNTPGSSSPPNKPADKFNDGPVHVSIWENESAKGAFRVASFEIRYRDAQEQWQTGKSYTASDLLHLEAAAREARSRIETWRHDRGAKASPRR